MAKCFVGMTVRLALRSQPRHFCSLPAGHRCRDNPRAPVPSSVPFLFSASSPSAAWFCSSSRRHSSFDPQPAPPRLPPEEQAEFERLLREASESINAASLADALAEANAAAAAATAAETVTAAAATPQTDTEKLPAADSGTIEGVWRGAPPEFDGDRNPKTGEVGGPKNEPLRWGSDGDWSYNGRVTDF